VSEPFEPSAAPPKEDPEALVLRGRPRPAVRFRRGLIVGISGAVLASLIALSWLALEPPSFRRAASALDSDPAARERGPEALADLPSNYANVPRLGPPLPGDLGKPILDGQRSGGAIGTDSVGSPDRDQRSEPDAETERQRLAAEARAARSSAVIVQLGGANQASAPDREAREQPRNADAESAGGAASGAASQQQHKVDFARGGDAEVDPNRLHASPSPWTLSAGTVIPASLVTGLNSDLPGMVIAQVTENVRDSATGRTVLIPQGARLIGSYDSILGFGQHRALLVWNRIVFPDGSSIRFDTMPASDVSGYAGLSDRVDSHTWQLLKGVVLSTLLGVGTQISLGSSESDLVRALRESTQQNAAQAGDRITSRNLEVQPTITVRPGWPVRALVREDLVLKPWSA
jgi:type IV secretory pathway VirB10-like protein